ncbi:MAG TPA: divergent polysaccharide deacetylase family protein [Geopsychrobacteraceae bacterium]
MTAVKKKAPKRKKSTGKKTSRAGTHAVRLLVSSLFLVVFVGSCLYGLVHLQKTYPDPIQPSYREFPMEEPRLSKPSAASFEEVYALLADELLSGAQARLRLPAEGEVTRLKMSGAYPEQRRLMELATRIALTDSPAQLDLAPRKGHVRLFWHGRPRVELRYDVAQDVARKKPLVAIIMDDMGRSLAEFELLLNLKIPVTPAILPQAGQATRSTALLQRADREYMIHIPMQPKSYPAISPGPNALLLGLSEKELRSRMKQYQQQVPGAAGGNNHMGSLFTQQPEQMRIVLEELRTSGLFFIDSKTIGASVAFDEARRMGMRTGARHIFLDNEENVAYIRKQLRKMVRIAEEKGEAIAICHPYRQTFEALQREEDWLRQQQVDFVVASRLAVRR